MEDNKKENKAKEVKLEDLAKVTGGSGLRNVKKEKTHDISDDTKSKI